MSSPAKLCPHLGLACLMTLSLAHSASTQTGPYQNGEIVVRVNISGVEDMYRIDPLSGVGAQLLDDVLWYGTSGTMVYDPWRRGLLCPMSLWGQGQYTPYLYVVDEQGQTTPIVSVGDDYLRAFAPVGNGRVYFQPWGPVPPHEIQYLDAQDGVHELLDATGTAPLDLAVEMMIYDAPSNALIATTSGNWSGNPCTTGAPASVFRIPLTPDGTQVAGPISCTSIGFSTANILGIDNLPSGDLLITLEDNSWNTKRLVSINPVTLVSSTWANEDVADLNGGFYSDVLGAAVILDNAVDTLRVVAQGSSGLPPALPATVPVGTGSTGFGPGETMTEIDTLGTTCNGLIEVYGTGLAGSCNSLPRLAAYGCPDIGSQFTIVVSDALGGAFGYVFVGLGTASIPFKGGTFLVGSLVGSVPVTLSPGTSCGVGTLSVPLTLVDQALSGVDMFFQAGFVDSAGPLGVSLSNGLKVRAD